MLCFTRLWTLLVIMVVIAVPPCLAHEPISTDHHRSLTEGNLLEAQLAFKDAQFRLYQYRYVDYPRWRRELDDAAKLTQAQIEVFDCEIASYRPFRSVGRYSPTVRVELGARLSRLEAKQHIRQLQQQRTDLWRGHADRCRMLEMEVLHAAARVAVLQQNRQ